MHSIASADKSTQTDEDGSRSLSHSPTKGNSQPPSPIRKETEHVEESDDDDDHVNELDSSIQETSHVQTAIPLVARARVVQVPKRIPPSLPPRNPNRMSQSKQSEREADGFDTVSLNGSENSNITLERRKSGVETDDGAVKSNGVLIGENTQLGAKGAPGVAGEEEFHSVPPSPAREQHRGIPGAFESR